MMGELPPDQNALFYEFCLENYVPQDHLLRKIEPLLDLSGQVQGVRVLEAERFGFKYSDPLNWAKFTCRHYLTR